MFGFSALFGRSREIRRLDDALRSAGLHPNLVPDAVKITTLKFLKEDGHGSNPSLSACSLAADMLAYCMLGDQGFFEEHGEGSRESLESRLQVALDVGNSLDARLVLLTLHADLTQGTLIERYNLSVSSVL